MNLLILNHYATDPSSVGGTRHHELATRLIARGWDVTIVASSVNHFTGRDRCSGHEKARIEMIDGVRFVWVRTTPYKGNGVRRVLGMLVYAWRASSRGVLSQCPNPDVVIGSSVHPLAAVAAARVAHRWGVPFVFEVRDLWPETLIAFGAITERSMVAKALRALEAWLYNRAVRIIVLLPNAGEYIARYGTDPTKVCWIPNGITVPECAVAHSRQPGGFRIHYVGSHGAANALECVVDAMAVLRRKGLDGEFELHLYGGGPRAAALKQRAAEAGLRHVHFHGVIAKRDVPSAMRLADALVLSVQDLPRLYRFGISMNKLYEYMAASRPIIAAMSAWNDPVSAAGCGIVVPPDDPERLANAMVAMASLTPEERDRLGHRGFTWVRQHNDFNVLGSRLDQLLRGVAAASGESAEGRPSRKTSS
jgi:glycosyltransferase involved in cell wall biosynthesis